MRQRFGAVPTAALVDVMDDLGLREQTLPPSIGALAAGMRLAGQAFTVEGAAVRARRLGRGDPEDARDAR